MQNLNFIHTEDIITSILTTYFFKLFFHWSFQIREIFYFFIIFILGYKLKKQIKLNVNDEISLNNRKDLNNPLNNTHNNLNSSYHENNSEVKIRNDSDMKGSYSPEDINKNMNINEEITHFFFT